MSTKEVGESQVDKDRIPIQAILSMNPSVRKAAACRRRPRLLTTSKIPLPKGSTGRVPLRVASTCAKIIKGSPSVGVHFRHQGFKLMMHAGTLKFRGASQLSTQIVKVSSIKPESAQQGSNRLIRMQVTNAELANGRMESRHIIGKQGCPRKTQPLCTSSK